MKKIILLTVFYSVSFAIGKKPSLEKKYENFNHINKEELNTNVRDLLDTLDTGLYDSVSIGFGPGDIIAELHKAPGNLTLNGIGINVQEWNSDGATVSLSVEVFRQASSNYPFSTQGGTYGYEVLEQDGWLGYAHPSSSDSIAYPDLSFQPDLVWNNFSSGSGPCSNETEIEGGQPLLGDRVLPVSGQAIIQKPDNSSAGTYFVDFSSEGSAEFSKDEYFLVLITYMTEGAGDPTDESSTVYVNSGQSSNIYPRPGLKYFSSACSGPSGEHGWHVLSTSWNLQCVVNITGDIPPSIELYHLGLSTSEGLPDPVPTWTEIKIMAIIKDLNPSGGDDGVEIGILNWQLNSLTADTMSSIMNTAFNLVIQEYVYHTEMPGNTNGTTVYWWISAEDVEGNISAMNKRSLILGTLSTAEEVFPKEIRILGNYPNPFNPFTNILFSLDRDSDIFLKVFDSKGRLIKILSGGNKSAGNHSVFWDGTNQKGITVTTGVYFYRFELNQQCFSGKMMFLK